MPVQKDTSTRAVGCGGSTSVPKPCLTQGFRVAWIPLIQVEDTHDKANISNFVKLVLLKNNDHKDILITIMDIKEERKIILNTFNLTHQLRHTFS